MIAQWILLVLMAALTAQNPQPEHGSIGGIVLNSVTNEPMSGVTIQLARAAAVHTAADGRFLIENVDAGPLTVQISKEGFQSISYPPTLKPGQHLETTQRLSPLTIIAGRVVDTAGQPVMRGHVNAYHYEYRQGERELLLSTRVETDDRGEFRLSVDPDNYVVRVFPPIGSTLGSVLYPGVRELARAVPVEIKSDGQPQTLRLALISLAPTSMGWIRVHIINATGEPIFPITAISSTLMLREWGPSFVSGQIIVRDAATGPNLELREYRPDMLGVYDIVEGWDRGAVSMRGGAHIEFKGTDVDVNVIVSRPTVALVARILMEQADGESPKPVANANLNLENEFGWSTFAGNTGTDGTVTKLLFNGLHTIQNIGNVENYSDKGIYVASARQGERDVLADGLLASGARVALDITMSQASGVIIGVVTGSGGRPLSGAGLGLVPEHPSRNPVNNRALYRSAKSGSDGRFTIEGVLPGSYQLYAWSHCVECAPGENSSRALITGKYKNAEFMKQYDGLGIPVTVVRAGIATVDVRPVDE